MIWVIQLLPLPVGKGGNVPKVLEEEDGAVPIGAVPVLDGGRLPERGPLGALNGTEPVENGNPEEGAEPVGAGKPEEGGRLPERGPLGALKGTEPVENGNPEEGDIVPDRGPLGALKGTEPDENGKPDDGRDPLGTLDGKNEDAPELREIVDESRPPEREPRELVNGGRPPVVSTGNDSVNVVVNACGRVDEPVTTGAEELELGDMVPLRGPLGALKGTEIETVPVGMGIESVKISGLVAEAVLKDPVGAGAVELELGEIVPLRGPLGALKGTEIDPVPRGMVSVNVRGLGVEIEPDAAVPEDLCVPDRLSLLLPNGTPPEAADELANAVPDAPLVIKIGVGVEMMPDPTEPPELTRTVSPDVAEIGVGEERMPDPTNPPELARPVSPDVAETGVGEEMMPDPTKPPELARPVSPDVAEIGVSGPVDVALEGRSPDAAVLLAPLLPPKPPEPTKPEINAVPPAVLMTLGVGVAKAPEPRPPLPPPFSPPPPDPPPDTTMAVDIKVLQAVEAVTIPALLLAMPPLEPELPVAYAKYKVDV